MTSGSFNTRPATAGDVPLLTELRLRTIHQHIVCAGTVLSLEEHRLRASSNLESCSVFEVGRRPIGMMKVLRTESEWSIDQIQIEPKFQSKGIGTEILRSLQSAARTAGVRLTLRVLEVNPARRLYERLGFEVIGEEEGIYAMQSKA